MGRGPSLVPFFSCKRDERQGGGASSLGDMARRSPRYMPPIKTVSADHPAFGMRQRRRSWWSPASSTLFSEIMQVDDDKLAALVHAAAQALEARGEKVKSANQFREEMKKILPTGSTVGANGRIRMWQCLGSRVDNVPRQTLPHTSSSLRGQDLCRTSRVRRWRAGARLPSGVLYGVSESSESRLTALFRPHQLVGAFFEESFQLTTSLSLTPDVICADPLHSSNRPLVRDVDKGHIRTCHALQVRPRRTLYQYHRSNHTAVVE